MQQLTNVIKRRKEKGNRLAKRVVLGRRSDLGS
jgi:hypothetical protein